MDAQTLSAHPSEELRPMREYPHGFSLSNDLYRGVDFPVLAAQPKPETLSPRFHPEYLSAVTFAFLHSGLKSVAQVSAGLGIVQVSPACSDFTAKACFGDLVSAKVRQGLEWKRQWALREMCFLRKERA